MPLTVIRPGETVMVQKINGKDSVRQHLVDLGFVVGGEVTVVNRMGQNLILQVKDGRVALDGAMASRILVRYAGQGEPADFRVAAARA